MAMIICLRFGIEYQKNVKGGNIFAYMKPLTYLCRVKNKQD